MAMDRYTKTTEVWFLLHQVEQLVINDKDYHPAILRDIANCMDRVEDLQHALESAGE